MSNSRIKNLLTELADNALSSEFREAAFGGLNEYQKDVLESIHKEYVGLVKQGTQHLRYNIDPVVEKKLFNQAAVNDFIHHPDGTTFENVNKVGAAKDYLSLFKSKPEPTAAPSASSTLPAPSKKGS
jgi:hypothetical protein